jgi:hypothetical protein
MATKCPFAISPFSRFTLGRIDPVVSSDGMGRKFRCDERLGTEGNIGRNPIHRTLFPKIALCVPISFHGRFHN